MRQIVIKLACYFIEMSDKLKQKLSKLLVAFLLSLLFICMPFNAYSADLNYLDDSAWLNCERATAMSISGKSGSSKMDGVFKYFYDRNDGCFYSYFDFTESRLESVYEDVRVHFDVKNDSSSYSFAVDMDGICDCGDTEEKLFNTYQNFNYADNFELAMSIVEFNCKPDVYNIKIKLYIGGRNYKILDDIVIDTTKPTTTKPPTTKKPITSKAHKTTSAKQKTAKSTTYRLTKYKGSGANGSAKKYSANGQTEGKNDVIVDNLYSANGYNDGLSVVPKTKMSTTSKVMLGFGIGIGVIALGMILYAVAMPKKENKDDNDI